MYYILWYYIIPSQSTIICDFEEKKKEKPLRIELYFNIIKV